MGQSRIDELAPVRSPLQLAESYNPSIALAGGSSQIACRGHDISSRQHPAWLPTSARWANCKGKTERWSQPYGKNTGVLSALQRAGYHPDSSCAVQLGIHKPAPGGGVRSFVLISETEDNLLSGVPLASPVFDASEACGPEVRICVPMPASGEQADPNSIGRSSHKRDCVMASTGRASGTRNTRTRNLKLCHTHYE